jgi:hypothetical protein
VAKKSSGDCLGKGTRHVLRTIFGIDWLAPPAKV